MAAGYEGSAPVELVTAVGQLNSTSKVKCSTPFTSRAAPAPLYERRDLGAGMQPYFTLENIWRGLTRESGKCAAGGATSRLEVMAWSRSTGAVRSIENSARGPLERWREFATRFMTRCASAAMIEGNISFTWRSDADASLFLIPIVGFLPPDDPASGTSPQSNTVLLRDSDGMTPELR